MEISNYSVLIGTSFTCFLSSVLYFYKEYNFKENRYILYAIFTITAILMIDKLEDSQLHDFLGNSLANFLENLRLAFIFPVFIYLFITQILNRKVGLAEKFSLVFPFVFFTSLSIILKSHNDIYVQFSGKNFSGIHWLENFCLLLFSSYLFYKLHIIFKTEKNQNTLKVNESWLKQIISISFFLSLSFICFIFYKLTFDFKVIWFSNLIKSLTSLYFFWLCFRGISELRITEERNEINLKLKNEVPTRKVKEDFTVKNNNSDDEPEYLKGINKLLEIEKLYRETDLSRERMAEKLGISPGYLSEVINSNYQQNFSTLINSYRIKEALNLLKDPEFSRYSIVAIAYEVGFNSKSAFYNAFKKETGTTPSVYLSQPKEKIISPGNF